MRCLVLVALLVVPAVLVGQERTRVRVDVDTAAPPARQAAPPPQTRFYVAEPAPVRVEYREMPRYRVEYAEAVPVTYAAPVRYYYAAPVVAAPVPVGFVIERKPQAGPFVRGWRAFWYGD